MLYIFPCGRGILYQSIGIKNLTCQYSVSKRSTFCASPLMLPEFSIRLCLLHVSGYVSMETRKGLQMYGCIAIVICMYFVGMYVDYF